MQLMTRIALAVLVMAFCNGVLAAGTLESEADVVQIELENSPFRHEPVTIIDSAAELKADFTAQSTWLDFKSSTTKAGEVKVAATVSSDGLVTRLEAVVSADQKSVTWTGNGGLLTKGSRDALRRLLAELELILQEGQFLPHQEWAFRLTNLWSEAPLNLPLRTRIVRAPNRADSISPLVAIDGVTAEPQAWSLSEQMEELNAAKATCASGCNASGGDGKIYLRGSCRDCGCALGTYSTKHDACVVATGKGHCYSSYSVQGGCSRNKGCVGRCGPGCGLLNGPGGGSYTKDCLEHDHCVAHDSAAACCVNDPKCGDEFGEAEDDFLFAVFNCNGCT